MKIVFNNQKSIFLTIIAHLLFCAIVISVFGNNCLLRPAAFPNLYKEYLSGAFVLAATYFCALVLHPVLFSKNRKILFVLCSLLVTLMSATAEIALVFHEIQTLLASQFGKATATRYIVESFLFVWCRDIGFAAFAFLYCETRNLHTIVNNNERLLLQEHDQLLVKTKDNTLQSINMKEISHGTQRGNFTEIHMIDGNIFYRYNTLGNLIDLLGNERAIRISRNQFVTYPVIDNFDNQQVVISTPSHRQQETLFISRRMSKQAIQLIHDHSVPMKETDSEPLAESNSQNAILKNKHYAKIYSIISQKPDCKVKDIKKHVKLSTNSIYRYLSTLKQQGLIEHVGANKTGGYRVVERLEIIDER